MPKKSKSKSNRLSAASMVESFGLEEAASTEEAKQTKNNRVHDILGVKISSDDLEHGIVTYNSVVFEFEPSKEISAEYTEKSPSDFFRIGTLVARPIAGALRHKYMKDFAMFFDIWQFMADIKDNTEEVNHIYPLAIGTNKIDVMYDCCRKPVQYYDDINNKWIYPNAVLIKDMYKEIEKVSKIAELLA